MNRQINFGDRSIQLNNAALSDEPKDLELFTYEGLPHGLTSGRALYGDRNVHKVTVPSKTLSEEWKRNDRHNIRMIKVDRKSVV